MLARILKKLSPLTQPCTHRRRYLTLKKHAAIFAEIRTVFRIEQQKGEAPLNCSSNASALAPESENITEAISSIAQKIRKKAKASKHSTILTKAADQINKYRNKISNQLKLGSKVYPLPRTNNLCEISFRELKRGLRRSSGKKNLSRILDYTPAEIMLLQNLHSEQYRNIVFVDKNIHECFSTIERDQVESILSQMNTQIHKKHISPEIKKIDFMELNRNYFLKIAG